MPISTRSVSTDCTKDLSPSVGSLHECANCFGKSSHKVKTISSGINTDRHLLAVSGMERHSIDPKPCEVCESKNLKTFSDACWGTDNAITGWGLETGQQLSPVVTTVDTGTDVFRLAMQSFGVQVIPSYRSAFIQTVKEIQPQKPSMKNCGIGTCVDVRHRGTLVVREDLSGTREIGVGDTNITDIFCETCIQKPQLRSVGVGFHSVKDTLCSRCATIQLCSIAVGTDDRLQTATRTVGCGQCSVHNVVCDRCENKCMTSVGVSTDLVGTERGRPVHLCDKCRSSITSMAHDVIHKTKPLDQGITTIVEMDQTVEKSSIPQHAERSTREFWRRRIDLPTDFFINKGFSDGRHEVTDDKESHL